MKSSKVHGRRGDSLRWKNMILCRRLYTLPNRLRIYLLPFDEVHLLAHRLEPLVLVLATPSMVDQPLFSSRMHPLFEVALKQIEKEPE